jgi:hypothetical protein
VHDFKSFEERPEDATVEVVYIMNELNLSVSIEDMDELIAFYSEPMSNENFIDKQEKNKTPLEAEVSGCQSRPTKNLTIKQMKEAFDHLKQFLSIMEECDLNAERNLQVGGAVW